MATSRKRGSEPWRLILAAMAVSLALLAVGIVSPPPAQAIGTNGSIAGSVVTADGGPLPAHLRADIMNAKTGKLARYDPVYPDGTFNGTDLETGTYAIFVWDTADSYVDQWFPQKASLAEAHTFSITSNVLTGTHITGVKIVLQSWASISGAVTAFDDGPTRGIVVTAYDAVTGASAATATVKADARYTFAKLRPGTYSLLFHDPLALYADQWYFGKTTKANATVVSVRSGQSFSKAGVILQRVVAPPGSISGKVSTADGTSLDPGAVSVGVFDASSGKQVASAKTSVQGVYSVTGLAPGKYKVRFSNAGVKYATLWYGPSASLSGAKPVTVVSGVLTKGISVVLGLIGGSISGSVKTEDGQPVPPGTEIRAYNGNSEGASAVKDVPPTGEFRFSSLAPGSYSLVALDSSGAYAEQWYAGSETRSGATPIVVAPNTASGGYVITLNHPRATISGTVTTSDAKPTPSSLKVWAYDSTSTSGHYLAEAAVGADGGYSIPNLPAGSYRLKFWGAPGYVDQWYSGKATEGSATIVKVTAGQSKSAVNITLQRGAVLSGTISTADKKPLPPGLAVRVFTAGTGALIGTSTVKSTGRYSVAGLPAGSYRMQYLDPSGAYVGQWYAGKPSQAASDVLTVTAGQVKTGLDVVVQKATFSISGVVKTSDGKAVPGNVHVYAFRGKTSELAAQAQVDSDGSYLLIGLAAGDYTLDIADLTQLYAEQWYLGKSSQTAATVVSLTTPGATTVKTATIAVLSSVSGTVTTSDGQPLSAQVLVQVFDADTGAYAGQAYTGAGGTYSVTGLKAGSYKVQFSTVSLDYASQWYSGAIAIDGATVVAVAAGKVTKHIDATLQRQ